MMVLDFYLSTVNLKGKQFYLIKKKHENVRTYAWWYDMTGPVSVDYSALQLKGRYAVVAVVPFISEPSAR